MIKCCSWLSLSIYGIDNSYMETNNKSVGYEYGVMILTLEMPVKTT